MLSEKIQEIYLKGQYGMERMEGLIEKARNGEITPNTS